MTKKQKVWLGIFTAMFVVPEVLWGTIFNAGTSILGLSVHSVYYNLQIFDDHPGLAYLIIITEIVAVSGLLYLNFKRQEWQHKIQKVFFTIILMLLNIALLFLLFLNFAMSGISFP
jgi:hypothetical protein